jgi:hypothetical protein
MVIHDFRAARINMRECAECEDEILRFFSTERHRAENMLAAS